MNFKWKYKSIIITILTWIELLLSLVCSWSPLKNNILLGHVCWEKTIANNGLVKSDTLSVYLRINPMLVIKLFLPSTIRRCRLGERILDEMFNMCVGEWMLVADEHNAGKICLMTFCVYASIIKENYEILSVYLLSATLRQFKYRNI